LHTVASVEFPPEQFQLLFAPSQSELQPVRGSESGSPSSQDSPESTNPS